MILRLTMDSAHQRSAPLLAALLVVVLIGQGFSALASPCAAMATVAPDPGAAGSDHAHHGKVAGNRSDSAPTCCDGGFCSQQHCTLAIAIPNSAMPGGSPVHSVAAHAWAPALPHVNPATPFKPPISA
jgi:hypothetical protein